MRITLILSLLLGFFTSYSQIEKLSGPRVGFTFVSPGSAADILNEGFDFSENQSLGYGNTGSSFTTQYGWQWESRFADGGGDFVGIVEWVLLVAGLEKGLLLPSASSLIGIRSSKGLELAIGPNLSLTGVGMAFAVGYNFKSGKLNIPVNLAFIPGIKKNGNYYNDVTQKEVQYEYSTGSRISLLIGFNMTKSKK
jgi:uncharacterized membrane protein (UPF0136 family)